MASTLVHIKSKLLLPPEPGLSPQSADDPRSELVRQLQDYERYRLAAMHLAGAEAETLRTWRRPASLVAEFEGEAAVVADLFALLTAFKRMLDVLDRREEAALTRDRVSLLDRIRWLLDRLRATPRAAFTSLFDPAGGRSDLIVTFLALLELIRLRVVGAIQTERFGEIEILLLEDSADVSLDPGRYTDA
jgi:segregation and condensation protein A